MYYISVSYIDPHVAHIIEYISRLCIFHAVYRPAACSLRSGLSGKAVSEMTVYRLYKPRTVTAIGKACSSCNIRISYKLLRVGSDLRALPASG